MSAKYTKSQNRATQRYLKVNYDQINIRVPKGKREIYRSYAKALDKSLAQLITELLEADMENTP